MVTRRSPGSARPAGAPAHPAGRPGSAAPPAAPARCRNLAGLALDDEVDGDGTREVWALYTQVLRELAHHSGHADILREQVLGTGEEAPGT